MGTVLADINWDNFMSAPVNDCWDNFKVLLFKLSDDYVPLKDIAAHKTARKPIWIMHKVFRLVQRKIKSSVNTKIHITQQLNQHEKQLKRK